MRVLLTLAILTTGLPAQESFELSVDRKGAVLRVSLRADKVSAWRLLSRMTGEIGGGVALSVDPKVMNVLQESHLPIRVDGMLLDELLENLGCALQIAAVLDLDAGVLRVGGLPARRAPPAHPLPETVGYQPDAFSEDLRGAALRSFERALLLPGVPEPHEALYRMAMMHLRAGEWESARRSFAQFADKAPREDDRIVKSLFLGGACAMRKVRTQESFTQAKAMLLGISELGRETAESEAALEAQLLLVRLLLDEARQLEHRAGGPASPEQLEEQREKLMFEARLRLNRVILEARGTRLEALALLQKAEFLYTAREFAQAVATIERFDKDMQRTHPDLAAHVPFIRGLCLLRAGDAGRAALALMTAFEEEKSLLKRVRAGHALALAYLDLERPVHALAACRDALKLNAGRAPRYEQKLLLLLAKIQRSWEARDKAVASLERLLQTLDADRAPGVDLDEVFSMLGELMFEGRRFEEARAIFERLAEGRGSVGRARLMAARCALELQQPRAALSLVDRIDEEQADGVEPREVRRLRWKIYTRLGEHGKAALSLTGWKEKR